MAAAWRRVFPKLRETFGPREPKTATAAAAPSEESKVKETKVKERGEREEAAAPPAHTPAPASPWKSVVPKFREAFASRESKKVAAAEAYKCFVDSKDGFSEEFEKKKEELEPKTLAIYDASSASAKVVVKERTEVALKSHKGSAKKLLRELVKIGKHVKD